MSRPPAPHLWDFIPYIQESTDSNGTEPSKPFKYNPTQKLLIKNTLYEGAAIHYALHYTAFHCKAFSERKQKRSKTQESMLCFWSKGEISVTNAMTNISGKINKFSSERCVESRFIPWAVFLITVDIYRPLQTWWRRMIMKLSPSEFWAPSRGAYSPQSMMAIYPLRQCCFLLLKHNGVG